MDTTWRPSVISTAPCQRGSATQDTLTPFSADKIDAGWQHLFVRKPNNNLNCALDYKRLSLIVSLIDALNPSHRRMQAQVSSQVRQKRVLLIDDNADQLVLMKVAIARSIPLGIISTASTDQEAIDYLELAGQDNQVWPSIILLDLYMPKRDDGLQLLARTRQLFAVGKHPRPPIVMFSHSTHPGDIKACYEQGANSYFTKPTAMPDLIDLLTTFSTYWFDTVCLPQW